jgi:GH25 family lysozyme M1 (1,4-beta-N-acetylmuramidase)
MTILNIVDLSHYNTPINLKGVPFAWFKATQGLSYVDPQYASLVHQARSLGIPYGAYHFLDRNSPGPQAAHAFSIVGVHAPLFVDVERGNSSLIGPSLRETIDFVHAYRALGGICHLAYLPREYWRDVLNSPDLRALSTMEVHLTNAWYTAYSDSGPGWSAYGGVIPRCWQYTDHYLLAGKGVDANAYRGPLAEFLTMITGGRTVATDINLGQVIPRAGTPDKPSRTMEEVLGDAWHALWRGEGPFAGGVLGRLDAIDAKLAALVPAPAATAPLVDDGVPETPADA